MKWLAAPARANLSYYRHELAGVDALKALVTGATGFVGSHLVRSLLERGNAVRILARTPVRATPLQDAGAEVRIGDLRTPTDLSGITAGIDTIFHLGSVMRGSADDFLRVDIQGTEWLLGEAQRTEVRRFVYAGTLAGYSPNTGRADAVIDERVPLDDTGRLGNYARAKARCEESVLAAGARKPESVVVRLGLVCGSGASIFPPHVCKPIGANRVILFGDGGVALPLTLIDNAVDALICAATAPAAAGEIFNIVDDEALSQLEYLELLRDCTGGVPRVLRLPLSAYYALGLLAEVAAFATGKEPETTRYRISSRLARVRWDCSKAKRVLGWHPRVPLRAGLASAFRAYAAQLRR